MVIMLQLHNAQTHCTLKKPHDINYDNTLSNLTKPGSNPLDYLVKFIKKIISFFFELLHFANLNIEPYFS